MEPTQSRECSKTSEKDGPREGENEQGKGAREREGREGKEGALGELALAPPVSPLAAASPAFRRCLRRGLGVQPDRRRLGRSPPSLPFPPAPLPPCPVHS